MWKKNTRYVLHYIQPAAESRVRIVRVYDLSQVQSMLSNVFSI